MKLSTLHPSTENVIGNYTFLQIIVQIWETFRVPTHKQMKMIYKIYKIVILDLLLYHIKREVRSIKMSSLQGMVRPPIGWLNPNSSSAFLNNSWNEGWFKNETGIINLFFWLSPTYTAKWPFGTSADIELVNSFDWRRICLACKILEKRIAIAVFSIWELERWRCFSNLGSNKKDLLIEMFRTWYAFGDTKWCVYIVMKRALRGESVNVMWVVKTLSSGVLLQTLPFEYHMVLFSWSSSWPWSEINSVCLLEYIVTKHCLIRDQIIW